MLATIGSTSPYIGLFGTVWGIMGAFHGLGDVQQATLQTVAPGTAEALIATAMGSVRRDSRRSSPVTATRIRSLIEVRYDTFVEELSSILSRHGTQPCEGLAGGRGARMTPNGRKGRRLVAEMNVVPYIDVMLVLLIIFMVTAPLLTQGIKVDLPKCRCGAATA